MVGNELVFSSWGYRLGVILGTQFQWVLMAPEASDSLLRDFIQLFLPGLSWWAGLKVDFELFHYLVKQHLEVEPAPALSSAAG